MSDAENQSLWAGLGKTATLLAVLGGLYWMYSTFIKDSGPELEATVFVESIYNLPEVVDALISVNSLVDRFSYSDIYPREWRKENGVDFETASLLGERFVSKIEDLLPGELYSGLSPSDYSKVLIIRITNDSTIEAKDVVLKLPITGIAQIRQNGSTGKAFEFASPIEIKRIRNDSPADLVVWSSSSYPSVFSANQATLSHSDGVGEILHGIVTYGLLNALVEHTGAGGAFALFSAAIMALVFLLIVISNKEKADLAKRVDDLENSTQSPDGQENTPKDEI